MSILSIMECARPVKRDICNPEVISTNFILNKIHFNFSLRTICANCKRHQCSFFKASELKVMYVPLFKQNYLNIRMNDGRWISSKSLYYIHKLCYPWGIHVYRFSNAISFCFENIWHHNSVVCRCHHHEILKMR
jgi:hypothetical protein